MYEKANTRKGRTCFSSTRKSEQKKWIDSVVLSSQTKTVKWISNFFFWIFSLFAVFLNFSLPHHSSKNGFKMMLFLHRQTFLRGSTFVDCFTHSFCYLQWRRRWMMITSTSVYRIVLFLCFLYVFFFAKINFPFSFSLFLQEIYVVVDSKFFAFHCKHAEK